MIATLCNFLLLHELRVDTLREISDKSVMGADFTDLASLHHDDLVSIPDGRETMRDYYGGNVAAEFLPDLIYRGLDLLLIGLIQGRRGLI